MEVSIERSEEKAKQLQKVQHLQAEALATQSRIQKEIQHHAQLSQALLKKVTLAAANLQTIIDEAAVKARQLPALHVGGLRFWVIFIIFLALVRQYNPKAAMTLSILTFGRYITLVLFPSNTLVSPRLMVESRTVDRCLDILKHFSLDIFPALPFITLLFSAYSLEYL